MIKPLVENLEYNMERKKIGWVIKTTLFTIEEVVRII